MDIFFLEIFHSSLKKSKRAALARPFSGGAAMLTFKVPSDRVSKNLFCLAPGDIFIFMVFATEKIIFSPHPLFCL